MLFKRKFIYRVFIPYIMLNKKVSGNKSSMATSKLVCKSTEGNITISYNETEIVGYVASGGLSYDLEQQKAIARQIGVNSYISQFKTWFSTNTTGYCVDEFN